ncbi:sugar ABC transporter permease [Asanoa ishikariensis]|uniref:Multiple sugar transport system permease protein n=1 Tax=Asanoa ishikariensis TaxID=137265 RepID=A0A1H3TJ39_9ACTN|nr:sugar ABC transporter permease [Asanoa ishikariensis]GIF62322.1 sugar ABC transporter permease [Asanoa ishikariensis]SDZ50293.1 multiple sugar transport system permease protein [Asanoa ishikariensis]
MSTQTPVQTDSDAGRGIAPTAPRPSAARGQGRPAAAFLTPFVVLYLLFIIGPALYGLVLSFTDASLVKPGLNGGAGFGNYAEALGSSDFWSSLWHTLWFTILTTPPLVILGFLLALLANRVARGRWFFRLAFFAPYILPSAVVALIWMWLYTPALGLLDTTLAKVGMTAPSWLGDAAWAMPSLAITTVWWTLGFNFILYLAGLQEIPRDLYEAAAMDGAGPWQQIRSITIPMLGRTTTLVAVLQVIASLKVFDQMYLMTSGGPNFATRSILQLVYDEGFTNYRVGYAAAVSMLFFLVVLAVSAVWFTLVRRQEKVV